MERSIVLRIGCLVCPVNSSMLQAWRAFLVPQISSSMRSKPLLGGASPRHHALGHRSHQRPRGFWYPILAGRILRATRALAPGLPCNNSSSALLRRLIPRKISYPAAKRHARGPPELAGNREISGARRNPGPACSRPMTGTPKSYGSDHPGAWSGPRRNVNGEEGDSNGHNASSQGSRGVGRVGLEPHSGPCKHWAPAETYGILPPPHVGILRSGLEFLPDIVPTIGPGSVKESINSAVRILLGRPNGKSTHKRNSPEIRA
jgi:hypothetical protein